MKYRLRSGYCCVNYQEEPLQLSDQWAYVKKWLSWESKKPTDQFATACQFWEQAKAFYDAAVILPETSSPLLYYYCVLNATKALLISKGTSQNAFQHHGVTEPWHTRTLRKSGLSSEIVKISENGALVQLLNYFNSIEYKNTQHRVHLLMRNLPFLEEAFLRTYPGSSRLFIPIENPQIELLKDTAGEFRFSATIDNRYIDDKLHKILPEGFFVEDECEGSIYAHINMPISSGHREIRERVFLYSGNPQRWYIKRGKWKARAKGFNTNESYINLSSPVITFAILHRLSSLVRYDPVSYRSHLKNKELWLVSEFLSLAPAQFINEIASEITGTEIELIR